MLPKPRSPHDPESIAWCRVQLGDELTNANRLAEGEHECLYKKGGFAEARKAIARAPRLGTRDTRIYYHAGMIYHSSGYRRQGAKYLKLALEINSSFDVLQAEVARRTLDNINV